MQTESKDIQLDGWRRIYVSGEIYWEWYDCGRFVIRCTLSTRDRILEKSGLLLKIIDSEIVGILTDF
jgi:hypothetical protein